MKVLQLCNKPPYPTVDGGTMAMHCITEGLLAEGCEVKVLSVCSEKHPAQRDRMGEEYLRRCRFESVQIDLSLHWLDALVCLLCGESYHVKRFISKEFEAKLVEVLRQEEFDVVHLESIFMAPYLPAIRKHSRARVVLRPHNVEHQIWRRIAQQERHPLKRWYLKKLALALRMYELEQLPQFDAVLCITPDDARCFKELIPSLRKPVWVIPFGIETTPHASEGGAVPKGGQRAYHLGAMDWMPNQEGVRWLAHEVWPLVQRQCAEAQLFLAGRRMPQEMLEWQLPGIHVEGEVPSAEAYMADKSICLVPLFSGSGIRVKMLEAMAAGKAVVSTSIGLQGIEAQDGEHLLVADTAEDFAHQIVRLLQDSALVEHLSTQARQLVSSRYDKRQLARQLIQFYNTLLEQ